MHNPFLLPHPRYLHRLLVGFLCLMLMIGFTFLPAAHAADAVAKAIEKNPPESLSAPFREILSPQAVQVKEGDEVIYEFWLVKKLPLQSKPSPAYKVLETIQETTLLGAAKVHSPQRDYKDGRIDPGVFTVRFGLQPQDGNHLGTSLYPYFALLIPAEHDKEIEGISSYDQLVEGSSSGTPSEHPRVLALFPVYSGEGETPAVSQPKEEHQAVRLQLPAKIGDEETMEVRFDLVFEGTGEL